MSMCVDNTPLEHYPELGLWVKREDLCCPGGPNFSKTRGVYSHVAARSEKVIGVLDTAHSQGGHAVAKACNLLGKQCVVFYPRRKSEGPELKPQQQAAKDLGAQLIELQSGRSAVLYHRAKKFMGENNFMMPNALKLMESVEETAAEVARTELPPVNTVLVSASSGTIAAGVLRGLKDKGWEGEFVVHLGYSRPRSPVFNYLEKMSGVKIGGVEELRIVDEGYAYGDACNLEGVPFPCNVYYDRKAVKWWLLKGRQQYGEAILWNVG